MYKNKRNIFGQLCGTAKNRKLTQNAHLAMSLCAKKHSVTNVQCNACHVTDENTIANSHQLLRTLTTCLHNQFFCAFVLGVDLCFI